MMLTAINANTEAILDVTLLATPTIELINGKRVAKRHGYDLVCKGCHRPAHLVKNHRGTIFFRHDPGTGSCILNELSRGGGESEHHLNGKATLITAIRDLTGWDATPEVLQHRDGNTVTIDVAATYNGQRNHDAQGNFAWEVQLSPQTAGVFHDRTETIRKVTGYQPRWLTPHTNAVNDCVAMICDPKAELIVDRLLTSYEPEIASPPLPVATVVKSVHKKNRGHLWFQFADGGYRIVHIDAFRQGTPRHLPGQRPTRNTHGDDTTCTRPAAPPSTIPPLGNCICGYPSWMINADGDPMHPCCADNGPNCEPCRISRDAAKRRSI